MDRQLEISLLKFRIVVLSQHLHEIGETLVGSSNYGHESICVMLVRPEIRDDENER